MPRLPMMPALQKRTSMGCPLSFPGRPCTSATSVTSTTRDSAPASFNSGTALRTVPRTRQPSCTYWRASSKPSPRPAPVIRMVGIASALDLDRRVGRHQVEQLDDVAVAHADAADRTRLAHLREVGGAVDV